MLERMFKRSLVLNVDKAEVMQRLHNCLRIYPPRGSVGGDDFVLYRKVTLKFNRISLLKVKGGVSETEEGCRVDYRVVQPMRILIGAVFLAVFFPYTVVNVIIGKGSPIFLLILAAVCAVYALAVLWQVHECADGFERKLKGK